jgi:hypothetical protein
MPPRTTATLVDGNFCTDSSCYVTRICQTRRTRIGHIPLYHRYTAYTTQYGDHHRCRRCWGCCCCGESMLDVGYFSMNERHDMVEYDYSVTISSIRKTFIFGNSSIGNVRNRLVVQKGISSFCCLRWIFWFTFFGGHKNRDRAHDSQQL